jgi:hypothetical protein
VYKRCISNKKAVDKTQKTGTNFRDNLVNKMTATY